MNNTARYRKALKKSPSETIVIQNECVNRIQRDGTLQPKSHSHVEQTGHPAEPGEGSLVGWRLYGAQGCLEITGFNGREYAAAFLPARGREAISMSLADILKYRLRYGAKLVRADSGRTNELKHMYGA